ncbi:hypothetical protein UPYG_G00300860 [Umbra pygmaea]|uniref:Acyl-CoA-binding domain-containing protein 5 n=1 Tax=Umbra pygmaea TaxID=75934 RepID=A0ABD0WB23_UMBPY
MDHEEKYELQTRFDAAVRVIRNLPGDGSYQPADDMMLMFYSYYKQATLGPCNVPRPRGYWDTAGKAKWDAWNSLGNMSEKEAMQAYVNDIQLILETLPVTEEVSDLLEALGGVFFEEVDGGGDEVEDTKSYSKPFAAAAEEMQRGYVEKPKMEGFGNLDIWKAIQTKAPESKGRGVLMTVKKGSLEERKEESKNTDFEVEKVDNDEEEVADDEQERVRKDPDLSLLRVVDPKWRSDGSSSNGSLEPSVSSVTSVNSGTHSSLNSAVEEEELAYSKDKRLENRYRHLNGRLSEHLQATESDNEEFCDSIEHLAMEEESQVPRVHSSGRSASQATRMSQRRESSMDADDDISLQNDFPYREGPQTERRDSCWSMSGIGSISSGIGSGPQLCTRVNEAEHWVRRTASEPGSGGRLNEHVAVMLARLQEDMVNVLQRLNALEALTAVQTRSLSQTGQDDTLCLVRKSPPRWPFQLSPPALVFATIWPLITHWLVHIYLQRKRKCN